MRVVQWHGWLLDGSGSNVYTARVTERLRRSGHDVLLLCQEGHPDRYPFIDAFGTVSGDGVSELQETHAPRAEGRAVLLRPDVGAVLPVFVVDEYEGFEVKRFVELTDDELRTYLDRNVAALRAALAWHGAGVVVTGHAIPGAVIGRRATGPRGYVAKVHGSDIEYAIRIDDRYRDLAREGLVDAAAVVGGSNDVLVRMFELVPEARALGRVVPPGVDERFHPMPRDEALGAAAGALDTDPETARGRPPEIDERVREALARRDGETLTALVSEYDQQVPDPDAARLLRSLAGEDPLVGFFGKLIPQKGAHLFLQALCLAPQRVRGLVVGFGGFREWLHALVAALDDGDVAAARWIAECAGIELELSDREIAQATGLGRRVGFTGRLDHRYAPGALAALDVLAIPSVLHEAFGMVVVEGAAAGALPLVARHSGLAEIADALERAVDRPGLFSYDPGPGSVHRIADGIDRLLSIPSRARASPRQDVASFASREWSWQHTADALLGAARTR